MKDITQDYLLMIYLFHIIIVAIPLLYFGLIGQHYGKISQFGYAYITLLGGMALVYHTYWFINKILTNKEKSFT